MCMATEANDPLHLITSINHQSIRSGLIPVPLFFFFFFEGTTQQAEKMVQIAPHSLEVLLSVGTCILWPRNEGRHPNSSIRNVR